MLLRESRGNSAGAEKGQGRLLRREEVRTSKRARLRSREWQCGLRCLLHERKEEVRVPEKSLLAVKSRPPCRKI